MHRLRSLLALLLLLLIPARPAAAYSVLSHEEVVDMAWLTTIVPMLRARFPGMTDADIVQAHAYAYGGSVIQDIGYYPFGSHYFSDLLHYTRTGDFVAALITNSTTPNEYAFALGALAHYCGDVYGHPAVNITTAQENPKDERRFGHIVTYDEDHTAHVRTEFGFDVVEVAHGRYSQQNYRDFIGFQVAKPLLERAFLQTYGIPMASVMTHEDLAIATYRRAVSSLIPKMTVIAAHPLKDQIRKEDPGFQKNKFVYRLNATEYRKEYPDQYQKPGAGTRFLAFIVEILPKIGPLKAFKVSIPTPDEQKTYITSVNTTVDHFKRDLALTQPPVVAIPGAPQPAPSATPAKPIDPATVNPSKAATIPGTPPPAAQQSTPIPQSIAAPAPDSSSASAPDVTPQRAPDLAEIDLDTGNPSSFGEYHLADITYAHLLDDLLHKQNAQFPPDVRQSIKDFYNTPLTEPAWYIKSPKQWATLQANLAAFRALPPPPPDPPPASPTGKPAPTIPTP
jgi:hypothetical protein